MPPPAAPVADAALSTSTAAPRISAAVLQAREAVAAGREKLRRQHESGTPGVQVCAHFTDLLEGIVVDLFRDALSESSPELRTAAEGDLAVVAHSGFGRRAMATYSDIDLMLLHEPHLQIGRASCRA